MLYMKIIHILVCIGAIGFGLYALVQTVLMGYAIFMLYKIAIHNKITNIKYKHLFKPHK